MSASQDITEAGPEFCEVYAAIHAESFEGSERWSASAFRSFLEMPRTLSLIASQDNEPTGFILARLAGDEAEILTLAVSRTFRRRGVAMALLRALRNRLENLNTTQLFLEVSARNEPAKALYLAADFEKIGTRPRYYADGSDADIMIWMT
ncbi:ribosomal protein S18-alanine N-acetyltransferase [Acetobacter oeni]|uniref:[Ribosomal protein bS18]-alanine N-acetyltransferase n=1 Tax=Acetobacter oeni TaxID=304077 RepID=A0A511XLV1_9PROT|nr:ribosomal protein S18-alanine N-acetyltransferase [Acetobacter oeni]MBB3882961.1 ribosomal-protein-alanine N-acetyltransferase [Acetobacter oeni]NHO19041.1 ribosomal-protein-alanine N-acetyltransferase [Acetobacter oeni]GBR09256.1 ribosomal protein alanine acetyltransferase [Acetobacter oeni LMG 21952]GEN63919.1 alanine acetyltransferase [Acetobacter oeni]